MLSKARYEYKTIIFSLKNCFIDGPLVHRACMLLMVVHDVVIRLHKVSMLFFSRCPGSANNQKLGLQQNLHDTPTRYKALPKKQHAIERRKIPSPQEPQSHTKQGQFVQES